MHASIRRLSGMNLYQRGKHRKLLPLQLLPVSSSRTWHLEEEHHDHGHGHGHGSHGGSAAGDSLLHTPAGSRGNSRGNSRAAGRSSLFVAPQRGSPASSDGPTGCWVALCTQAESLSRPAAQIALRACSAASSPCQGVVQPMPRPVARVVALSSTPRPVDHPKPLDLQFRRELVRRLWKAQRLSQGLGARPPIWCRSVSRRRRRQLRRWRLGDRRRWQSSRAGRRRRRRCLCQQLRPQCLRPQGFSAAAAAATPASRPFLL